MMGPHFTCGSVFDFFYYNKNDIDCDEIERKIKEEDELNTHARARTSDFIFTKAL